MTATTTEFSLSSLVDSLLSESDDPDPGAIASAALDEIPQGAWEPTFRWLLRSYVREHVRAQRARANAKSGPGSSPKWARAADDQASGRLSLERYRVFVPGDSWKFLPDLTLDDVRTVAQSYDERAAENAAVAQRYRRVADAMTAAGATVVAHLPRAVLEEAFNA